MEMCESSQRVLLPAYSHHVPNGTDAADELFLNLGYLRHIKRMLHTANQPVALQAFFNSLGIFFNP